MRALCQKHGGLLLGAEASQEVRDTMQSVHASLTTVRHGVNEWEQVNAVPTLFFDNYFVPYNLPGVQLKLFVDRSLPDTQSLFAFNLVLFHADDFSVHAIYSVFKRCWQQAPQVDRHYRVIRLSEAFKISHESPAVAQMPVEQAETVEAAEMQVEYTSQFTILARLYAGEPLEGAVPSALHVRRYLQVVCDLDVVRHYFFNRLALRTRALDHYGHYVQSSPTFDRECTMLLFLSYLIDWQLAIHGDRLFQRPRDFLACSENVHFLQSASMNPCFALYDEWLLAEVRLFRLRNARPCRAALTEMAALLTRHRLFIGDNLPPPLQPAWLEHTLASAEGPVFWLRCGDKWAIPVEVYLVASIYRHFNARFSQRPYSQIHEGRVLIDEQDLWAVVVPYFYQSMLADLFTYLVQVHWQRQHGEVARLRQTASGDLIQEQEVAALFDTLALEMVKQNRRNSLAYRFVMRDGDLNSPVVRALVQRKARRAEEGGQTAQKSRVLNRETMPDLEDLCASSRLAPCMQRLVAEAHLRNMDRLNVVRYLIDMKYKRDETVRLLTRGERGDREYKGEIESQYVYYSDRVRRERSNGAAEADKRFSMNCSSIINMKPNGGVLRCIYEEKEAGEKRRNDYSYVEKQHFMAQCCQGRETMEQHTIRHPVDHLFI